MKTCCWCKRELPLEAFPPSKQRPDGLYLACRECHRAYAAEWRKKNRRKLRDQQLRKKYGISIEQYEEIAATQDGRCAICRRACPTGRMLAVDHDHDCCPGQLTCGKCIRALLCTNCNKGVGMFGDDPQLLLAAAAYLMQYQNETAAAIV
jgi:hypothetical protein